MTRMSPQTAARRAETLTRIYDAAEAIMVCGCELTAGAVADKVGIKRNSLYRYIDSIDSLRAAVIGRRFPAWIAAVQEEVRTVCTGDPGPERGIAASVTFVEANLRQASHSSHGWLVRQASGLERSQLEGHSGGHAALDDLLTELVSEALESAHSERCRAVSAIIRGIIATGFSLLDTGWDDGVVIAECTKATRAILAS